jgi:prepilin-type N-terminal cleavage/methylation domain-containing protein
MRAGFTLIEVLVALILAGLGVSIAGGVFGATSDGIERVNAAGERWTRTANARSWLAEALMSAETDASSGMAFVGSASEMHFSGWQWTGEGWVEPASIDVFVDAKGLAATTSRGLVLRLIAADGGSFQYLPRLGAETSWEVSWQSDAALPAAVRIITFLGHANPPEHADTLVLLVGAGG